VLVGLVLFMIGIIVIVSNPFLGFIPGILLIVVGIVAMAIGGFGKGAMAMLRLGSTRTCPECRSSIPAMANVCRYCGHRLV
jgi:ribosomal protein L40E